MSDPILPALMLERDAARADLARVASERDAERRMRDDWIGRMNDAEYERDEALRQRDHAETNWRDARDTLGAVMVALCADKRDVVIPMGTEASEPMMPLDEQVRRIIRERDEACGRADRWSEAFSRETNLHLFTKAALDQARADGWGAIAWAQECMYSLRGALDATCRDELAARTERDELRALLVEEQEARHAAANRAIAAEAEVKRLKADLAGVPLCLDTPGHLLARLAEMSGRDPIDRAIDDLEGAYGLLKVNPSVVEGISIDDRVAHLIVEVRKGRAEVERLKAIVGPRTDLLPGAFEVLHAYAVRLYIDAGAHVDCQDSRFERDLRNTLEAAPESVKAAAEDAARGAP